MQTISYIFDCLTNSRKLDFIRVGLGIRNRRKRFESTWESHFDKSITFQKKSLENNVFENVAILGAGSLFDIDVEWVKKIARNITLVDADPGCRRIWKAKLSRVSKMQTLDLTGSIDGWTDELSSFLSIRRDEFEAGSFLKNQKVAQDPLAGSNFDLVISLNLLGQLPIYWKDRAIEILKKQGQFLASPNDVFSPPIEEGLEASYRALQNAHLKQLENCCKKSLILITDTEFLYYDTSGNELLRWPALFVDTNYLSKTFHLVSKDSWEWELFPPGTEEEYGSTHIIKAEFYTRNN